MNDLRNANDLKSAGRRDFLTNAVTVATASLLPFGTWPRFATAQAPDPFAPDVELELVANPAEVQVLPGRPTRVWRYEGRVVRGPADALQAMPDSFVGPVLRFATGQRVRIRYFNRIPQPSIVHWHGLVVPDGMDGHPRDAVPPEGEYLYEFEVRNRAGTYWFHPHPHGLTGPQVNAGLAGLLIVSDVEEEAADLPRDEFDLPIVLADRTFDRNQQLVYQAAPGMGMMGASNGFVGEQILANGRPALEIEAANSAYRVRLLNGSNSRIYRILRSDDRPLVVIASDGGLLEAPEIRREVVFGPGERIELWLDLHDQSPGSRVALLAQPLDYAGTGMVGGMGTSAMMAPPPGTTFDPLAGGLYPFAVFAVEQRSNARPALAGRLSKPVPPRLPSGLPARSFTLGMTAMRWAINGRTFKMDEVAPDERVALGDTEVWEFANPGTMMAMPHPMHVHGVQFRVLERGGTARMPAWLHAARVDGGFKDTVLVLPGERVRLLARFDAYPGTYLYHCHNLEHEDMGMMRNFAIG